MGITLEEIEGFEGERYNFRGFSVPARAFASYAIGDRVFVQWQDGQPLTILSVTARPGVADDTSPLISGGLEALITLTRNGVRELWFVDAAQARQLIFPVFAATQYGALLRTATTVSPPVWGQLDNSFFLTFDRSLPSEKTLVVRLNRPGPGSAMASPAQITGVVEASLDFSWYAPSGAGAVSGSGSPVLDASAHLVQAVSWQFIGTPLNATGYCALLDLTSRTVRLTIPVATFSPPSFAGQAGLGTSGRPTIFHLDAAAPANSRIGVVASAFGIYDVGHPDPGPPTPNHSFFVGVVDGNGLVRTLSPWTGDLSPGQPAFGAGSLFADAGTRRHAIWSIGTGPFGQQIFLSDLFSGVTIILGTETVDGFGVAHPAVAPGVVSIRPDFALRVTAGVPPAHIDPYFVQWWDKSTGKILLPNPLTDAALQTEDPRLAGNKTLKILPAEATPLSFSYHVVEDSPAFPYRAAQKNPA